MPPENKSFCKDHSHFVELCGGMDGKIDILIKGQEEFRKDIQKLWETFRKNEKDTAVDSAVQKTKIAPVFWVIAIAGCIIISSILTTIVQHVWPATSVSQPQIMIQKK